MTAKEIRKRLSDLLDRLNKMAEQAEMGSDGCDLIVYANRAEYRAYNFAANEVWEIIEEMDKAE